MSAGQLSSGIGAAKALDVRPEPCILMIAGLASLIPLGGTMPRTAG